MTIDPAHQSTLAELAATQRERDELRRYAARLRGLLLRVPGPFTDGSGLKARVAFLAEIHAATAGEIEPQDPAVLANPEVLASGSPVKRTSESVSVHIYQDRVNGEGFVLPGLDVEHRRGEALILLWWESEAFPDEPGRYEITFAQAEQFRDALTEVLSREPVKQDPGADAAEDEAYRVATARMDAAEAREDAAEKRR